MITCHRRRIRVIGLLAALGPACTAAPADDEPAASSSDASSTTDGNSGTSVTPGSTTSTATSSAATTANTTSDTRDADGTGASATSTGPAGTGSTSSADSITTGGPMLACEEYADEDTCLAAGCSEWTNAWWVEAGCSWSPAFYVCLQHDMNIDAAPTKWFKPEDQSRVLVLPHAHLWVEGWTSCRTCTDYPELPECENTPVELCACT